MEMFTRGQLTMEQCRVNPYRHLITRCLGHEPDVAVDITEADLKAGDCVILASDGLSGVVDDEQIADLVRGWDTSQEVCDKLLSRTLAGGAPDNVTILVISYEEAEEPVKEEPPVKKERATAGKGGKSKRRSR